MINKNQLQLKKVNSKQRYSPQRGFLAPLFQETDLLSEKNISLSTLNNGHYLLIDFWGTWCAPCLAQIPDMKELYGKADTTGFKLLSIASFDTIDSIKSLVQRENIEWPQMLSNEIAKRYGVDNFPSNFLINPDGVILYKNLSIAEIKEKLIELGLFPN